MKNVFLSSAVLENLIEEESPTAALVESASTGKEFKDAADPSAPKDLASIYQEIFTDILLHYGVKFGRRKFSLEAKASDDKTTISITLRAHRTLHSASWESGMNQALAFYSNLGEVAGVDISERLTTKPSKKELSCEFNTGGMMICLLYHFAYGDFDLHEKVIGRLKQMGDIYETQELDHQRSLPSQQLN